MVNMGEKGETVIREATLADYNSVMDINRNVYQNFDYLPQFYHHFAHDPSHTQFVAEIDSVVVAYCGIYIIEGQTTYVGISARTHPDYQRQGLSTTLEKYTDEWIKKKLGKEIPKRWTAVCRVRNEAKVLGNPQQSILLYWNYLGYHACMKHVQTNIKAVMSQVDLSQVNKLNIDEVLLLLQSAVNVQKLKSYGDYIICGPWFPFKVTAANLKVIAKTYNISVSIKDGSCYGISTFHNNLCIDGCYKFDIHYHGESTFEVWSAHFIQQLDHILHMLPSTGYLKVYVHFPLQLSVGVVEEFLRPLFGRRVTNETKAFVVQESVRIASQL